jgi:hypothetical protein
VFGGPTTVDTVTAEDSCRDYLDNVKAAVCACLVFDADPNDPGPAERVWRLLVGADLPDTQTAAHLKALELRRRGASITARAREKRLDVRSLRMTPHYTREFAMSSVPRGPICVSVDQFNAADELGIGRAAGANVVELFRVAGTDPAAFVDVASELFDRSDAKYLFGGVSFYVESFVQLCHLRRGWEAQRLLWPLTGFTTPLPADALVQAFRVIRGRGTVVQAFADLWTGHEAAYTALAHALGKQTFWELGDAEAAEQGIGPGGARLPSDLACG